MTGATVEQTDAVMEDLVAFVHRVTTDKDASPAEIAVLPGIVRAIFDQYPRR